MDIYRDFPLMQHEVDRWFKARGVVVRQVCTRKEVKELKNCFMTLDTHGLGLLDFRHAYQLQRVYGFLEPKEKALAHFQKYCDRDGYLNFQGFVKFLKSKAEVDRKTNNPQLIIGASRLRRREILKNLMGESVQAQERAEAEAARKKAQEEARKLAALPDIGATVRGSMRLGSMRGSMREGRASITSQDEEAPSPEMIQFQKELAEIENADIHEDLKQALRKKKQLAPKVEPWVDDLLKTTKKEDLPLRLKRGVRVKPYNERKLKELLPGLPSNLTLSQKRDCWEELHSFQDSRDKYDICLRECAKIEDSLQQMVF